MPWTPNISDGHFTGWAPDSEDRRSLRRTSIDADAWMRDLEKNVPLEIDPRPWHTIEDQGGVGSCQGHANTSVCEAIYNALTDETIQLCRMFAYRGTQVIDGISSDQGSTIGGGAKFAKDVGHCLEELWPYRKRYEREIPRRCYENAKYKIKSHIRINDSKQAHQFIGTGQGFLLLGIMWERSIDDQVGAGGPVTTFSGNGRGGHAIAVLGYTWIDGQLFFIVANSWSVRWGQRGWFMVSAKALDQMLRHRWTVCIGFTDLTSARPRKVNWAKEMEI